MTDLIYSNLSLAFDLCEKQWQNTFRASSPESDKVELLTNFARVSKRLGDYASLTGDLGASVKYYQKAGDIRSKIGNSSTDRELAEM